MNREQAEMLLAKLVFDELDEPTKRELLVYLEQDPKLKEQLGDMRLTANLLREGIEAGEAPRLSDRRRRKVIRKLSEPTTSRFRLRHAIKPWQALAACLVLGTLAVGFFLPSLGAARRTSRQMQSNTQLRGIHQSMVMYAQSNDNKYPDDMAALLEGNYFTPEYLISPRDNTPVPGGFDQYTPQEKQKWVRENSSYIIASPGAVDDLDTEAIAGFEKFGEDKDRVSVVFKDNHTSYMDAREARALIESQTGQTVEQLTDSFTRTGQAIPQPQSESRLAGVSLAEATSDWDFKKLPTGEREPSRRYVTSMPGVPGAAGGGVESGRSAGAVSPQQEKSFHMGLPHVNALPVELAKPQSTRSEEKSELSFIDISSKRPDARFGMRGGGGMLPEDASREWFRQETNAPINPPPQSTLVGSEFRLMDQLTTAEVKPSEPVVLGGPIKQDATDRYDSDGDGVVDQQWSHLTNLSGSDLAMTLESTGGFVIPKTRVKGLHESDEAPRKTERLKQRLALLEQSRSEAPSFDLSTTLSNTNDNEQSGRNGGGGYGLFGDKIDEKEANKKIKSERIVVGKNIVDTPEVVDPLLPMLQTYVVLPVNPWVMTESDQLSTFAIDVDTASYAIARRHIGQGTLPPAHTVRMEEFVNAFDYNYPTGHGSNQVFTTFAEAGPTPFGQNLTLLKVGIRGKVVGRDQMKPAHLVFVIDSSGSMDTDDRLPLVQRSLRMLLDQLNAHDRVSVVTYGTQANLLLDTVAATERDTLIRAVQSIQCQGTTNLLSGVELGYQIARKRFVPGGVNRVILCSDGVANVGPSDANQLLQHVAAYRDHGITFTSIGFGTGSYNDQLLEQLANQGDGSYAFVGSLGEATQLFVKDMAATRPTIARNVKIQVAFDPARVRRYRLIGYENRDIADTDFRNDTVDAGEVGSGQSATALYELELIGPTFHATDAPDLGTVYVRYENPQTGKIEEISNTLSNEIIQQQTATRNPRFMLAAAAGEFAELLRGSEYARDGNFSAVQRVLEEVSVALPLDGQARQLLELVRHAEGLPRATSP